MFALSSPHMQIEHKFFFFYSFHTDQLYLQIKVTFLSYKRLLFPLPTCGLNAKIKLEPECFNLANEISHPNPHYVIFHPRIELISHFQILPSSIMPGLQERVTPGFCSDTLSRRVFVNHIECFHGLYEHVNDQRREKGRSLDALKKQSERSGRVCAASGGSCRRGVFNSIPQNTDCFIIRQLSAAAAPVILSDV